jgi:hypothetical protein
MEECHPDVPLLCTFRMIILFLITPQPSTFVGEGENSLKALGGNLDQGRAGPAPSL